MDLIGINKDYTRGYNLELINNQLIINKEILIIKKRFDNENKLIITSNFITDKDNHFIKYFIVFNNELLDKCSYVIKGIKKNNCYIEELREYLILKQEYENYSKIFEDNSLFNQFIYEILPISNLNFLKNISNLNLKIPKFDKMLIINNTNLNNYQRTFIKYIFNKCYFVNSNINTQLIIENGENHLEIKNKTIHLCINDNFYEGIVYLIDNLNEIEELIQKHSIKEHNIEKIETTKDSVCEKGSECCQSKPKSSDCGKGSECCQSKPESKSKPGSECESGECCQSKPESECCKTPGNPPCNPEECKSGDCCSKKDIPEYGFILYMKGTKEEPKCKYSKNAVNKLNSLDIKYNTFDVLKNENVREKLKKKCPTYPQLWYKYKFVCDGDTIQNKENLMDLLEMFT